MAVKVRDGILGFAVGDALGVPVEFLKREEIANNPVDDMKNGGIHGQPKGTWSDDTSMVLATLDGIIDGDGVDCYKIADNFCSWVREEKYNAHDTLFDIGATTLTSLERYYLYGVEPTMAGGDTYYDNGNGSLMRILPLAYYFRENPENDLEIATIVNDVSAITHRHEISLMGCYLYTKYAMFLLDGKSFDESYELLKNVDVSMYSKEAKKEYKRILDGSLKKLDVDDIKSSGYVVDSLEASLWCCLTTDCYKDAVLKAVNLGGDTDTIAAIAGGLAGINYGIKDIPTKWLDDLAKRDYIESLADNYEKSIKKVRCK